MTTSTMKSKGKSTRTNSASTDAIELLTADHTEVQGLFKQYDALTKDSDGDIDDKVAIARQICQMLTVHATVEEEIFYPAAREALAHNGEHMLNEAEVEHASAKDLIAQIADGSPDDDGLYDAKVKVLGEYIEHHVKEEEGQMFPKLKKAKIDTKALGADMAQRKAELVAGTAEET